MTPFYKIETLRYSDTMLEITTFVVTISCPWSYLSIIVMKWKHHILQCLYILAEHVYQQNHSAAGRNLSAACSVVILQLNLT